MSGKSLAPSDDRLLSLSSDYNYVPDGRECVLAGPQPIPPGECLKEGDTYLGSSGYRKIPGDTCVNGEVLDRPKMKDCSEGQMTPGLGGANDTWARRRWLCSGNSCFQY